MNFKVACYKNESLKTKVLVPSSFTLKYSYFSLKIFENKVGKWKWKLNSLTQLMIYIHYWPLFSKNCILKYTAASQRLTFNSFPLFDIVLSHRFLSYYLFSNSYVTSVIYIAYRILWGFLLCNVLHNIGNMYWWIFLIAIAIPNKFQSAYLINT